MNSEPAPVRNVENVKMLARNSDLFIKCETPLQPLLGEVEPIFATAEKFDLHLLKLARTKGVVPRVDLVSE